MKTDLDFSKNFIGCYTDDCVDEQIRGFRSLGYMSVKKEKIQGTDKSYIIVSRLKKNNIKPKKS